MALANVHSRTLLTAQTLSAPFTAEDLITEYQREGNVDDPVTEETIAIRLAFLILNGYVIPQYLLTGKGLAYDPDDVENE